MSATELQRDLPTSSFVLGNAGAALLTGCWGLLWIIDYGTSGEARTLYQALLLFICSGLFLAVAQTGSGYRLLFSGTFWLSVNIAFYIVLKSLDLLSENPQTELTKPLLSILTLVAGYVIGRIIWSNKRAAKIRYPISQSSTTWRTAYRWLLLSFIFFKILYYLLFALIGGGDTILDVSLATQNQGAAYLFRIPTLAQICYLILLIASYKHRLFVKTSIALTVFLLIESVLSAGRSAIIVIILTNMFLTHMYVKPIRWIYLIFLTPLFLFIVAFFGYVRNIEIGNLNVYSDALDMFMDDGALVLKLFMSRLDMLPQMIEAFRLDALGKLHHLYGASYVYAFLHAIPRTLWPGKPPLTAAYLTERTHPDAFSDGVNIYPSIVVESFLNFGWIGVLFGGLLIAKLTAIYERFLYSPQPRLQAFAFMFFTFPMGVVNEGFHSNNFASILYMAALYAIWLWVGKLIFGNGLIPLGRNGRHLKSSMRKGQGVAFPRIRGT